MNKNCSSCGSYYCEVFDSLAVFKEHEGFLMLTLAKDPSSLENSGEKKAAICTTCAIKIFSGLLQMEVDHMKALITEIDSGLDGGAI